MGNTVEKKERCEEVLTDYKYNVFRRYAVNQVNTEFSRRKGSMAYVHIGSMNSLYIDCMKRELKSKGYKVEEEFVDWPVNDIFLWVKK
jgi:hypothetical protein